MSGAPSGEAVLDPDEQAQHVVRLVFSTFRRLGTLNGVLRYLVERQVQLPVRVHSGPAKGVLEWPRPIRETLLSVVKLFGPTDRREFRLRVSGLGV